MDQETLYAQEQRLVFPKFDTALALAIGQALMALGEARALPIAINIRTPNQTLFHAALPGATPLNDLWARRKSNAVLTYHMASLRLGAAMREGGKSFAEDGLDAADYASHGGSFPIRLAKGGPVIAAVTVSGLPQREDHALVIEALESLISS
jgi:uncharacterized protein (UPF0303 family)